MLPVGVSALLIEVADGERARAAYGAVVDLVRRGSLPAPRDVVPAARTVLIDGVEDPRAWYAALERALGGGLPAPAPRQDDAGSGEPVTISVRYDGPDLEAVARAWECAPAEVAGRHANRVYTVAFFGFAPGFAYCTADPALPAVPRRDEPRPAVPAGAVGLAGEYCGIYPRTMPGGWQLVGTTDAVMFDPRREAPALLQPGDWVRFRERP